MKSVLVYLNPNYAYGQFNGATKSFNIIDEFGDWLKIDGEVQTTNHTMTNVIHKDRVVFYQGSSND